MELKHFSHKHPLVFIENQSHESDQKAYNCSGCGEVVSGSSYFSCAECGYHLDKICAEAPLELNHLCHGNHSLELHVSPPYIGSWAICSFCGKICDKFVYHCSCNLDLHIKCALFSNSITEKKFREVECVPHDDPLISKEGECFACWKPLSDSPYLSLDFGFCLHKKCADLPLEINHPCHTQHSLILQFNSKRFSCKMCQTTQLRGFVYCCLPCKCTLDITCVELPTEINHLCHRNHPLFLQSNPESLPCKICQETKGQVVYYCSTCKFAIHVKCASPTASIKGEIHEHEFTLFWKHFPFICDACGTTGNYASYICSTCSLTIHEKCVSLSRTMRLPKHRQHLLSHSFILWQHEDEIKTWKCRLCPEVVNAQYGSYFCSKCNYTAHVNCAKEDHDWYKFYEETDEEVDYTPAFSVIKAPRVGEDLIPIEIEHLSHQHNLVLSNDVKADIFCDGCRLQITISSFYYCLNCDFFLHKSCAESPRTMYYWNHVHQRPLTRIFSCNYCEYSMLVLPMNAMCVRSLVAFDVFKGLIPPHVKDMITDFPFTGSMKGYVLVVEVNKKGGMHARIAIFFWIEHVSIFPARLYTNVMNILSCSPIMMMLFIRKTITVTFVNRQDNQTFGSVVVHFVTLQLILTVWSENTLI